MSTIIEGPFINATRKATEAKGVVGKRRGNRSASEGLCHPSSRYFLSIFLVNPLHSTPLSLVATPLSRRRLNLGVAEALLLDESWPRGSINCFLVSCNTNGVSEAEFVEADRLTLFVSFSVNKRVLCLE